MPFGITYKERPEGAKIPTDGKLFTTREEANEAVDDMRHNKQVPEDARFSVVETGTTIID